MMREKKICPLMAVMRACGKGAWDGGAVCEEAQCGWWSVPAHKPKEVKEGRCALVGLADALSSIDRFGLTVDQ